jgi:hypothetical protein
MGQERGMQPNFLVPFMWNVGHFQRNDGVMSLFQVSKELHRKGVDIPESETVMQEWCYGNEGKLRSLELVCGNLIKNNKL